MGKHLKEYKKQFISEIKKTPRKYRRKIEKNWKKRWFPFIKYDHDFDSFYFMELIVHKLHIMLDYYEDGRHCWQVDESRLEIVESLREACRLGDLILEDRFNDPAFKIMEQHHTAWLTPMADDTMKCCSQLHTKWDSEEAKAEYDRLMKETDKLREKTITEFFDYLRKHYREWWD